MALNFQGLPGAAGQPGHVGQPGNPVMNLSTNMFNFSVKSCNSFSIINVNYVIATN